MITIGGDNLPLLVSLLAPISLDVGILIFDFETSNARDLCVFMDEQGVRALEGPRGDSACFGMDSRVAKGSGDKR